MTPRGTMLVTRQEIRTRLRTGRWKTLLAVWFLVVNGFGLLFRLSLGTDDSFSDHDKPGVPMFGGMLLGVLVLTLLITPALSGQSINGDRERGTLATLQLTRLTPGDIALGKLAAAWGTGLLALLLTLPSVLFPVLEGAVGIGRAAVVLVVTTLLIGVVCAVSQAWSAVLARSITSVLMSYLTVFALLAGTPLLFMIATPLTADPPTERRDYSVQHTERVWWLLAPNPVVVLADAAPRLSERRISYGGDVVRSESSNDPLGELSREVRDIRQGPDHDEHDAKTSGYTVWTYGLLFDLALATGAVVLTARRLRTPVERIPRGVRVA